MATDRELMQIIVPLLEMIVESKQRISEMSKVLALKLPDLSESEKKQLLMASETSIASAQNAQALINQFRSRM